MQTPMRDRYGKIPLKSCRGLTIVQLMLVLFVLGIVMWAALNLFIDSRCATEPSEHLCASRSPAWLSLTGK
jgi:hypothetical protein